MVWWRKQPCLQPTEILRGLRRCWAREGLFGPICSFQQQPRVGTREELTAGTPRCTVPSSIDLQLEEPDSPWWAFLPWIHLKDFFRPSELFAYPAEFPRLSVSHVVLLAEFPIVLPAAAFTNLKKNCWSGQRWTIAKSSAWGSSPHQLGLVSRCILSGGCQHVL